ncbi:unnamed protein product [Arctogadus glacialis]
METREQNCCTTEPTAISGDADSFTRACGGGKDASQVWASLVVTQIQCCGKRHCEEMCYMPQEQPRQESETANVESPRTAGSFSMLTGVAIRKGAAIHVRTPNSSSSILASSMARSIHCRWTCRF